MSGDGGVRPWECGSCWGTLGLETGAGHVADGLAQHRAGGCYGEDALGCCTKIVSICSKPELGECASPQNSP